MQASPLFRTSALLLAVATAVLAGCRKDEVDSLEGPMPTADFTVSLDTTQFPVVATFTSNSTDAFLYQWDFGDGSPLVSGTTVKHTYNLSRIYQARLIVAGRGGSADAVPQDVRIKSICSNPSFNVLTSCGNGAWTYSSLPGAITYLRADGVTVDSATTTLNDCRADDEFVFSNSFNYSYVGRERCTNEPNFNGSSGFIFRENGNLGQITLRRRGTFIGVNDTTQSLTYDIIEARPDLLRIRSTRADGGHVVITLVKPLPPLEQAKRYLTGGSERAWVLDETEVDNIRVGSEAIPARDYSSGTAVLPPCQADDEYIFNVNGTFRYDAKAQTFVAGDYSCQAPRSLTTTYSYGTPTGAGQAQFVLASSSSFIGTTNAGSTRTYRITEISNKKMVLRTDVTGVPGQLFTFKLRVK